VPEVSVDLAFFLFSPKTKKEQLAGFSLILAPPKERENLTFHYMLETP
jgi:hypothetical protein